MTVMIWGMNFAVVKQTLSEMLPMAFNALRFSVASALLTLVLALSEGGFLLHKSDLKGILILGVVGHTVYQFLFINGIARTTASLSSLMMATCPVFVMLLSLLIERRRPSSNMLLGASLSLIGVFLLVYGSRQSLASAGEHVLGATLVLAGSICWAVYTVLSKSHLARYSPLRITATTMVLGTVLFDIMAIPSFLAQRWSHVSLAGWIGFAYSCGLAIVLGYIIWEIGIHRIGPGKTAVYQNLTPVIATVASYMLLDEMLSVTQVAGAGMVFLGVYLARRA
jgi:drug/metabolite transporter (DMT)-like permease